MKNSFVVNYAVTLWLAAIGLTGFWGGIVAFFATRLLGSLLDNGLIIVDIKIDKLKEALKDPQWKAAAEKAYGKASAGLKTEEEKRAIRQEYLDALAAYATYGNGVPDDKHPQR